MKRIFSILLPLALATGCTSNSIPYGQRVTLDRETLQDKIKGGWAGQTIGCTFGGPTEFKHKGGIIHDEEPIVWYDVNSTATASSSGATSVACAA